MGKDAEAKTFAVKSFQSANRSRFACQRRW